MSYLTDIATVLTSSGGHRTTYGWQAGGTILLVCFHVLNSFLLVATRSIKIYTEGNL